jgi:uncharacterized protein (TIGR03083 family)
VTWRPRLIRAAQTYPRPRCKTACMILAPRYDGPTILSVDGQSHDQLQPFTRQRRRMQAMLAELTDEEWMTASRCAGWTARDVVAHLVGVNTFWYSSIGAGLAGLPTRVLSGFDPAATPPVMVDWMSSLTTREVFDQFVSTTDGLLGMVAELTDRGWSTLAETPAGHVPIRLLAQHALWDSWIHERDVAIPLGIATTLEPDELRSCLQYAAAISPVLGIGLGRSYLGVFAVEATNPSVRFILDVGESVAVRDESAEATVPCLRGDAVDLIEALSLRAPMPPSTPVEWSQLVGGLATAFDAL